MTSIPVSRAEFMKLISRMEQLEAEVSLLRNWMSKTCKNDDDQPGKLSQVADAEESDDEKISEKPGPSVDKSHKRLLAVKKTPTSINFQ